jgi:hypothetical protein
MRKTNRPCASRGQATAWRVSAALVALTSLGSAHLASAQEIPAIPIPQQPFAQPVPRFIGQPAIPKPITALPVPEDPYMAQRPQQYSHGRLSERHLRHGRSAGPCVDGKIGDVARDRRHRHFRQHRAHSHIGSRERAAAAVSA